MDDLCCAVCGQQANGQHFGIVCCRACAAFFRRWLDSKPKYKCTGGREKCSVRTEASRTACRACRLAACQRAGLREKHAFSDNGSSSAFSCLQKGTKNLHILAEAHQTLVEHQMRGKFRQSTKRNLFDLFNHAVKPFANLDADSKANLFESCARQLRILHRCCLKVRNIGPEPMLSFGGVSAANSLDQFAQKLASFPYSPSQSDFCALMALSLCTKAKLHEDLDSVIAIWKFYMDSLLSEWFIDLYTRMGSQNCAIMQMARLIATLPQLEEIVNFDHKFSELADEDIGELKESKSAELTMAVNAPLVEFNFQFGLKEDIQTLDYWSRLLGAHNRIWGAFYELDDSYLHKHSNFAELLDSHENLLGMAEQFTLNPPVLNEYEKAVFLSEIDQFPFHQHPRMRKSILVNRLLMVNLLKAMPAFGLLSRQDREILIHYHGTPLNFFIYAYYSALLGADCLADKCGLTSTQVCHAYKRYAGDEKLAYLAQKAYSIRPFLTGAPLPDPEEMGLLIAIHCSFPTIPTLSAGAQNLLYAEQSRYSKMLLRHLQRQLGTEAGVRRYAECLFLLNYPFNCARRHELFKTYIETFHLRRDYNATINPKVCSSKNYIECTNSALEISYKNFDLMSVL